MTDQELDRAIRAYERGDGAELQKMQRKILYALKELRTRRSVTDSVADAFLRPRKRS